MIDDAAPAAPQDPLSVRVVHRDHRTELLGGLHDLRQPGDIAVHREHAVRDDQSASRLGGMFPELRPKILDVGVPVAQGPRLGEPAGIDNRGVVQRVAEDQVSLARHGRHHGKVAAEAGLHGDGGLGALESSQLPFELQMNVHRPRDGADGPRTDPITVDKLSGPCTDARIVGQPKVIVGAEVQVPLAVDLDPGTLRARQRADIPVEPLPLHAVELVPHERRRNSHCHSSLSGRA